MKFSVFVSCPKGIEYLLQDEMKSLGLDVTRVSPQGVYGDASLSTIYTICLWSRLANRVHLILFRGPVSDSDMLYHLCHGFAWETVFGADKTLAIEFHGSSPCIRNTMFGAQRIKDALVDYFRTKTGERPVIDRQNPQIRLQAHLRNDELTVSFDMTGYSLHQRGYRLEAGSAPIKENIAAAMLIRANWHEMVSAGYPFRDLFCGSGTLVIEAAMIASQMAPGLLRHDQAFVNWIHHDPSLWSQLREAAEASVVVSPIKLWGSDINEQVITKAKANAKRAGVADLIEWQVQSFEQVASPDKPVGLVISNLPFGERQEDVKTLLPLYKKLGQCLHAHYQGWRAAILTPQVVLAKAIGLRAYKQYTIYNGPLECKLYCFQLNSENQLRTGEYVHPLSSHAQMFANRLAKNAAHLQKWAKRNHISCYRVYDADLPEYAYAIDLYQDYAVLQEYQAPASIPKAVAEKRASDVRHVVPLVLAIPSDQVIIKQRKRQKGEQQYEKIDEKQETMVVSEGAAKLKVNLYDYLDTGLFLDHRLLRLRFGKLMPGTKFLNCFCYTGAASIHAALAGAITTNVDLSHTYLKWAEENFQLNRIQLARHQFIQYDCLEWLNLTQDRFDVIFLDPPSFSNSKRMNTTLDIQRDHEVLIKLAMNLLKEDGVLYFSTNFRQFNLALTISAEFEVKNITAETIDLDFKRDQRIHHCFMVQPRKL